MSNSNRLFKNILSLTIVQFSNYIAPLLVLPYLTRILSVENFGIVVISFSICSIAMIITDFGFGLSGTYWISKNRNDKKNVASYIGAIYLIKLMLNAVIVFSLLLYIFIWQENFLNEPLLVIGILLTIIFQSYQPMWFFQGIERMKNVTICMVASKLIYLISVLVFVKGKSDSDIVLLCLALSSLVSAVLGIIRIYKENYKLAWPHISLIKEVIQASFNFFISRASVGIYTSASTFIVGSFSGLGQAALYSSAEKLYQAGLSISSPISQAIFPYLARSRNIGELFKILLVIFPLLVVTVFICLFYTENIIIIFYGDLYKDAAPVLRVFLITSLFSFISINMGYPAFSIYDRLDLVNLSVYIAAVLHILGLVILYCGNNITAINVSLCVCIIEFVVLIIRVSMFISLRKRSGN
ncbi:oligosaccharide flippase family protein [Limnobaculum parvum]|uniref:oligosaccharide flippase family protein n=1 Tax=Limnobaculum parvum TaxID=2172103 RepID=UPI001300467B|nr:oligosaccharide flippase family protein [Limnobaculum parvum]